MGAATEQEGNRDAVAIFCAGDGATEGNKTSETTCQEEIRIQYSKVVFQNPPVIMCLPVPGHCGLEKVVVLHPQNCSVSKNMSISADAALCLE